MGAGEQQSRGKGKELVTLVTELNALAVAKHISYWWGSPHFDLVKTLEAWKPEVPEQKAGSGERTLREALEKLIAGDGACWADGRYNNPSEGVVLDAWKFRLIEQALAALASSPSPTQPERTRKAIEAMRDYCLSTHEGWPLAKEYDAALERNSCADEFFDTLAFQPCPTCSTPILCASSVSCGNSKTDEVNNVST